MRRDDGLAGARDEIRSIIRCMAEEDLKELDRFAPRGLIHQEEGE